MKKSLIKDTFREIWKSKNRFLSILGIIALGTGFFAGVKVTCPDMKQSAYRYYNDRNLMDLRLISTVGFNDNDLAFIRGQEGIQTVMPAYSADVMVQDSDQPELVAKVYSLDLSGGNERLNRPVLLEGRLPQTSGECVIDANNAGSIQIGDKVTFSSGKKDETITDTLAHEEYTVVGTVNSPMYMNFQRGSSTLSDGTTDLFLLVPQSDFKLEVYTDVYLTFQGADQLDPFLEEYGDLIDQKTEEFETLSKTRAAQRLSEIKAEASQKLDEAKQELADGEATQQQELSKARQQLDDAKRELADGEAAAQKELAAARKQLDDAKAKLAASRKQAETKFKEAEEKLAASRQELNDGAAQYAAQKSEFDQKIADGQAQIDSARAQIQEQIDANPALAPMFEEALKQLDQKQAELDTQKQAGQKQLSDAQAKLDAGESQYAQGKQEYEASKAQTQQQLSQAQKEIDSGEADYQKGKQESEQKLADARKKIADGEAEYEKQKAESDQKLADARAEIQENEEKIASIEMPKWYVTDRTANPGYGDYGTDAERVDAIAKVFPVFFILVAALVCLTTMTRMVEEQRTQIGTLKALGYSKGSIIAKFLIYAVSASLLGSVIGLVIGLKLFPLIIFNAYGIMYVMPPSYAPFRWDYAAWCTLAAVLCTVLSALAACWAELMSSPAQLMRPKAPKAGKRILLERITPLWSRLSFSYKVSMRNIFRYKKRILMTVVGIAGCTALMLTGFGLQHAITSIADLQYNDIFVYDMLGMTDDSDGKDPMPQVKQTLASNEHILGFTTAMQKSCDVHSDTATKNVNLFVPEDAQSMTDFIVLRSPGKKQAISLPDDGAVINEKLAKMLEVKAGDTIEIIESTGAQTEVKVAAVTENYTLNYVYLSPSYYQTLYQAPPSYNVFIANNDLSGDASDKERGNYQETLSKQLLEDKNILGISYSSDVKDQFSDILGSLNYIVLVVIVCAGLLALIVLYNLTNINVTERVRELATIKVLGFYDKEVSAYIYRENVFSTLIGIAIGLVGGIFLNQFVITTSEVDVVMFVHEINAMSFILASVLTLGFTLLVNVALHFKLKKIDMTTSLKSIE